MAIQRCIAHTLYIRGLGSKGVLGWDDFSCCTGGKRPQRRKPATPTAGPGQSEPRQARPRGRPPKGAGPMRTTDGRGGGEWLFRRTPPQMQPKTWGLERGARGESPGRRPAPQPGEDRKQTPGHADGAGSHQHRGKEQPVKQEESGTQQRSKGEVW